jgi:hypothetical protein
MLSIRSLSLRVVHRCYQRTSVTARSLTSAASKDCHDKLRFCVVGAGPSGFYCTAHLLKHFTVCVIRYSSMLSLTHSLNDDDRMPKSISLRHCHVLVGWFAMVLLRTIPKSRWSRSDSMRSAPISVFDLLATYASVPTCHSNLSSAITMVLVCHIEYEI